jgi:hypothetical protein
VPINAQPGIDFIPVSGTLIFPSGLTSQNFSIPVLEDPYDRGNELVSVVLTNVSPSGAALGSPSTATLTIVDTDPNYTLPTVSSLTWNGNGSAISALNVNFALPMLASQANNPGNYSLLFVGPSGPVPSGIALSPSYNPASFAVTLTPSQPLSANQFYELVINGTPPGGLESSSRFPLAGDGINEGTNYVTEFATGSNLKYTTSVGDKVNIKIRGGGYLNDIISPSGQGIQLELVGEVPHKTVLSGTVKRGPHGTGRAYLGYTIYGMGKFGDVSTKMYSPPFQVDHYPLPSAGSGGKSSKAALRPAVASVRASALAAKQTHRLATASKPASMQRPFHTFRR